MTAPDHPIPYAEPISEPVLESLQERCRWHEMEDALGNQCAVPKAALRVTLARLLWLEDAYKWFSESGQARKDRVK